MTAKVVKRWIERYKAEGRADMADRSSRPTTSPRLTRQCSVERIVALRRQHLTGKHIALRTGVSPATVSRVLRRARLSRLKDIEPAEPVRRYERKHPGELSHLDIKTLGRFERTGHRITGDRTGQSSSRGVGWDMSMSVSTTPRASPSPTSCPTRMRTAPSLSSRRRSLTTQASASPSPAS